MEDHRDEVVVIAAGYEIEEFRGSSRTSRPRHFGTRPGGSARPGRRQLPVGYTRRSRVYRGIPGDHVGYRDPSGIEGVPADSRAEFAHAYEVGVGGAGRDGVKPERSSAAPGVTDAGYIGKLQKGDVPSEPTNANRLGTVA
jgi:hypothetical protein